MTFVKDIGWLLLIALLLLPLMAIGLVCIGVIVARQLYWWARGNTTAVSRPARGPRWSWAHVRPSSSLDRRGSASLLDGLPAAPLLAPGEPTPAIHT
jgi:hypothetical protein